MSATATKKSPDTILVGGKQRYYEPAPQGIDLESFRQVVTSRRSVRKFTATPVPRAVVDDCLDMAMLAPCSSGLQPWEFYVVRSAGKKAALVKACMSQSAAIETLAAAGFQNYAISTTYSNTVPAGLVGAQSPEPGAKANPSTTVVTIAISQGPDPSAPPITPPPSDPPPPETTSTPSP